MSIAKFTEDLLEKGRENEAAMSTLDMDAQAKFMSDRFRFTDSVVVLYPERGAPCGHTVLIVTGASKLAGIGVEMRDLISKDWQPKPTILARAVTVDAFLVESKEEATFILMAYGDLSDARAWRRSEERKDGRQAILNVRASLTPYGRALLKANPDWVA